LEKGIKKASSILNAIGMVILLALMLLGTADVLGRYLFNKPITGAVEMGQVMLAAMVFFAWGYTQVAKGHVNVELFTSRLRPRALATANFFAYFAGLVLFSLIVWHGALVAKVYWEGGRLVAAVVRWPLAPFQLLVSLGALVLCLVFIIQMLQLLPQMKGRD
jgi:TRAP-type C4-dicarboxylate transport system permease small subunit